MQILILAVLKLLFSETYGKFSFLCGARLEATLNTNLAPVLNEVLLGVNITTDSHAIAVMKHLPGALVDTIVVVKLTNFRGGYLI